MSALAKEIGRDHRLAVSLWNTGIPECRLLAPMIAVPAEMDGALVEKWVSELNSWDVCDGFCTNLVWRLPGAWTQAVAWAGRDEEFVRRAGFATMVALAGHAKTAPDKDFRPFLKEIERASDDPRNFVKKAVNWALRSLGKRSPALHAEALAAAERILTRDTPPARWIARNALRDPVQIARLEART